MARMKSEINDSGRVELADGDCALVFRADGSVESFVPNVDEMAESDVGPSHALLLMCSLLVHDDEVQEIVSEKINRIVAEAEAAEAAGASAGPAAPQPCG